MASMKDRTSKHHVETGGRNLPPSFQCWNPSCDHIHSYSTLAVSFSDHTEPCLKLCTSVRICTIHPMLLQVYGAQTHTVSMYASYAIAAYRIRHTRVTCTYALRVRMCVYVCECVYCTCVRVWCTVSKQCLYACQPVWAQQSGACQLPPSLQWTSTLPKTPHIHMQPYLGEHLPIEHISGYL